MARACEVCGRPLKTGRKYCWEHRHTTQAEGLRGEKLINDATKRYRRYRLGKPLYFIYKHFFKIGIFLALLALFFQFAEYGLSSNSKISLFAMIILSLAGLLIIIKIIVPIKIIFIDKEIENRKSKYIKWVKGWAEDEREEKEFRKSLVN